MQPPCFNCRWAFHHTSGAAFPRSSLAVCRPSVTVHWSPLTLTAFFIFTCQNMIVVVLWTDFLVPTSSLTHLKY